MNLTRAWKSFKREIDLQRRQESQCMEMFQEWKWSPKKQHSQSTEVEGIRLYREGNPEQSLPACLPSCILQGRVVIWVDLQTNFYLK